MPIKIKDIKVNELTWSKLLSLKIKLEISTFDKVVEMLLEKYDKYETDN
jgi:hypothetical protein